MICFTFALTIMYGTTSAVMNMPAPGSYFRLANKASNRCLYSNGITIGAEPCTAKNTNEQWRMIVDYSFPDLLCFRLIDKNSSQCLSQHTNTHGKCEISLLPCTDPTDANHLLWELYEDGLIYFKLRNKDSRKCLYSKINGAFGSGVCNGILKHKALHWSFYAAPQNITLTTDNWIQMNANPAKYAYGFDIVALMGELRWAKDSYMGCDNTSNPGEIGTISNPDAYPRYTEVFVITNARALAISIEIRTNGVITLRSWTVPIAFYTNTDPSAFYYNEQKFIRCGNRSYCAPQHPNWTNTFATYQGDGTREYPTPEWLRENMNVINLDGLTYVPRTAFNPLDSWYSLLPNNPNKTKPDIDIDNNQNSYIGSIHGIILCVLMSIGVGIGIGVGIIVGLKMFQYCGRRRNDHKYDRVDTRLK